VVVDDGGIVGKRERKLKEKLEDGRFFSSSSFALPSTTPHTHFRPSR
jgi:hypothetical protein